MMKTPPPLRVHILWSSLCLMLATSLVYYMLVRPTENDLILADYDCLCANVTHIANRPGLNLATRHKLFSFYLLFEMDPKSRAVQGMHTVLDSYDQKVSYEFFNAFFLAAADGVKYCEGLQAFFPPESPWMYTKWRYSRDIQLVPMDFIPCP